MEPVEKHGEDAIPGWGIFMTPRSSVLTVAPEFLVIVAADRSDLFPRIRRQFLDDPRVHVILDRRQWERGHRARNQSADRRPADQRRAPDYWEDPRYHPVVLVPTARRAPASRVRATPTSATTGGRTEATEFDQLCRWVGTGQELLARIGSWVETVEAFQREARELRRSLEERDDALLKLQAEVERLTRVRG